MVDILGFLQGISEFRNQRSRHHVPSINICYISTLKLNFCLGLCIKHSGPRFIFRGTNFIQVTKVLLSSSLNLVRNSGDTDVSSVRGL